MIPSKQEIVETTREILARAEFHEAEKEMGLLQRLLHWIFEQTGPLYDARIFFVIALIAFAYFCYRLFNQKEEQALTEEKEAPEEPENVGGILGAHRKLLTLLNQKKLIEKTKWKTNAHYVLECKDQNWQSFLQKINVDQEKVCFGGKSISNERVAEYEKVLADEKN